MTDQLHGIQETPKRLAISPWTLRRAIKRGEIRAVKIGLRRLLISEKELLRVIAHGTKAVGRQKQTQNA
jgi:excisionase family DNA binding protein